MRKGVSEVVGIVLLIFMVVAVSGSFYYWYSAGQTEAQVKTELFQADVFDQVVSRTSAIIDATYNTDREVNVNNFAEYKTVPGAAIHIAEATPHLFDPVDPQPGSAASAIFPSIPVATTITVVSLKSSS